MLFVEGRDFYGFFFRFMPEAHTKAQTLSCTKFPKMANISAGNPAGNGDAFSRVYRHLMAGRLQQTILRTLKSQFALLQNRWCLLLAVIATSLTVVGQKVVHVGLGHVHVMRVVAAVGVVLVEVHLVVTVVHRDLLLVLVVAARDVGHQ